MDDEKKPALPETDSNLSVDGITEAAGSSMHGDESSIPEAADIFQSVPDFPIVGIGASAGGLAAFEAFFSSMPPGQATGMAFVLVQHLAPDHKSILSELVRRYTKMEVVEVEDGMTVKPDCTYIIPPNRDMALLNGSLQLLMPEAPRGQRMAIDFFFRSLAQDQHDRAICIVLSGTGSDGTLGVRAIKGEGGMAMAQNPESTEYDGMPRSAISTGLIDFILPPAEMPDQLMAYASHAFRKTSRSVLPPPPKAVDSMKKIFKLLRSKTGHDFSQYKQSTIGRRIERRMAVNQIEKIDSYVQFLQQNKAEVDALFRDLLIGVTNFFRDPEAFDMLQVKVIRRLVANAAAGSNLRVWVPGCSTGEEAYSIAMMIQEQIDELKQSFKVQVFATDIDSRAIETARAGVYPASITADVSPERLARFFSIDADGAMYRINKSIRDLLIFSEQDIIKDPPFSKLDLISCRNLLIYMSGGLQKKLIPLFHYALNHGGMLFLGTSETIGEFLELFYNVDRKAKIYQKSDAANNIHRFVLGSILPHIHAENEPLAAVNKQVKDAKLPLREFTEKAILQHFEAVGILITDRGDILYLHGRTGKYLEPAPGEAALNILKMAREGLRRELTTALHKAVSTKSAVHVSGLPVKTNGDYTLVNLLVRPVVTETDSQIDPTMFLVIIEHAAAAEAEAARASANGSASEKYSSIDADERIIALKQELRAKDEYLQTSNEELETSNEELKSANEELQSVNEELQSTNEELETSKEELQSVNEELSTVNAELQQKVTELSRANNDMVNLLAGTGIGTIFVDHQLHIQRYTPTVTKVINLILTDVGRPVGHIVSNLIGYETLVENVQSVLSTLIPYEREVQTKSGDWYMLNVKPYRTLENVIEGAVITFFDITESKRLRGG